MRAGSSILILLLAVAALGLWRMRMAEAPAAASSAPPPSPAVGAAAIQSPAPSVAAAAAPATAGASQWHRADLVRRSSLEKELYRSQGDVLDFVRAHMAEARAGDGEAQLAIATALQFCEIAEREDSTVSSQSSPSSRDDAAAGERRRRYSARAQRCKTLDQARDEVGTEQDWLRQADRSGIGAAMLMEAGSADLDSDQARIDKVRQAVATGDPVVVTMLVAGSLKPEAVERMDRADVTRFMAAQQLTQCALGYDCSRDGPIFQVWCQQDRCQRADSVQRYYELAMNPQQFAEVQEYAATLAANIRSGGDNWPEAQALEQGIVKQAADSP